MNITQLKNYNKNAFDDIFYYSLNEDYFILNEGTLFSKTDRFARIIKAVLEDENQNKILGKNHVFLNYLISGVTKSLNYGTIYISGINKILIRKISQEGKIIKKSNVKEMIKNTTDLLLQSLNEIKVKIETIDDGQLNMMVNDLVTIVTMIKILGDTLIQTASILINNQTQSRLTPFIALLNEFNTKLKEYVEGIDSNNDDKKFNLSELTVFINKSRNLSEELMAPAIPDDDSDDKQKEEETDPQLPIPEDLNSLKQVSYNNKLYMTKLENHKLNFYDPIRSPKLFKEIHISEVDASKPVIELHDLYKSDNEVLLNEETTLEEAKIFLNEDLDDLFTYFNGLNDETKITLKEKLQLKMESINDFQKIMYNIKERLNGN